MYFSTLRENSSEEDNKSQETTFLAGAEIDFCYETKARKVIVDFKFDAL